jgi:hypothetical protein
MEDREDQQTRRPATGDKKIFEELCSGIVLLDMAMSLHSFAPDERETTSASGYRGAPHQNRPSVSHPTAGERGI